MNKFSLYDLLGLLFPGFILTWLLTTLSVFYHLSNHSVISNKLNSNLGMVFCVSMILGAALYVLNYALVQCSWYTKLTGLYQGVSDLYRSLEYPPDVKSTLNKAAHKWFQMDLFYTNEEFVLLEDEKKKLIYQSNEEFYGRMYYELEYLEKLESPKIFQSFYFFFRQLFSVCWIGMSISLIMLSVSLLFGASCI